MRYNIRK